MQKKKGVLRIRKTAKGEQSMKGRRRYSIDPTKNKGRLTAAEEGSFRGSANRKKKCIRKLTPEEAPTPGGTTFDQAKKGDNGTGFTAHSCPTPHNQREEISRVGKKLESKALREGREKRRKTQGGLFAPRGQTWNSVPRRPDGFKRGRTNKVASGNSEKNLKKPGNLLGQTQGFLSGEARTPAT